MTRHFTKVAAITVLASIVSITAGIAYASASEITGGVSSNPQVVAGSHATGTIAGNIGQNSAAPTESEELTNTSRSGGRSSSRVVTTTTSPADSTFISFAGTVGEAEYTAPAYDDTVLAVSDDSDLETVVETDAATGSAAIIDEAIQEDQNTDNLAAVGALGAINWGTWTMILVGLVAIGGIAYGVNKLIV
ncbi:MAG TPA: hypothetical protein VGE35_01745 [Candidatus Paceibacterota bacterium]